MEMYQDGIPVYVLPDGACCEADDARRSPIDLEYCPVGYDRCDSNCCFYEED